MTWCKIHMRKCVKLMKLFRCNKQVFQKSWNRRCLTEAALGDFYIFKTKLFSTLV